jgi:molybdopterin-guanine dinucleotide biosynthesis protein A
VTRTAGIVLCGGRSSRMGAPKAWLPFGAELMLPRVVRIVREAVDVVVVVAAPGQDVPPLPAEVRVERDEVEGRGPLGGLAAGLAALGGAADVIYLSSCDVPLLQPAFVRYVIDALTKPNRAGPWAIDAVVPRANDRLHPLASAYRLAVLPVVREMLAAGRFRMTDLFDLVSARVIEAEELLGADPDLVSLRNVNTPEEYEAAKHIIEFTSAE